MVRRARALLSLAVGAAAVTACSPAHPPALVRSPEPAHAPVPSVVPAGRVVTLDADRPEGVVVTPDSALVVVGARRPARLLVLALDDLAAPPRTVAGIGAPRHLQLDGSSVLVPGEDDDSLSTVDPVVGLVTGRVAVGDHPHDAAAAGPDVVVAEEDAHTVAIVRDGAVRARLGGVNTPGGVATTLGRAAVVGVRGRELLVIDVATAREVGRVDLGTGPSHVVTVADGLVAVADTTGDEVLLVDLRGRPRRVGSLALPGRPYALAADPVRGLLWVATGGDDRLHRVELHGTALVATTSLPTVQQPNSIAVVPATGAVVVVGATRPGRLQLLP